MNEEKKLISAIVIVAIAIILVSGGTLAYWQWSTSELQSTLVNGSPAGDLDQTRMYIDFPENELTNLYPTSDCDPNGTSSWVTEITIDNKTGIVVAPNFKLKVKIEDKNGNVITNVTNLGNTNPNRYYIKYAVTGENESCQNALATGRFDQNTQTFSGQTAWYDSGLITEQDANGFPVVSGKNNSGVSFHAKANGETTQRFRVYAWLDKEYTSLNVGTEVTDTMQDAKVTVSWSENSSLEQVKRTKPTDTEAIAIYSEDDNSLRFYRDTSANVQALSSGSISTYNGRSVTSVYYGGNDERGGFEDEHYANYRETPWGEIIEDVEKVVFEDYIYPVSTAYWFDGVRAEMFYTTKLDTSNVTNMSHMFYASYGPRLIEGIENWDVSNVTDMSYMFDRTDVTAQIDLSSWNVCKMSTRPTGFSSNGSIIEPNWGMSC